MIINIKVYTDDKGSSCCLCGEKITSTKNSRHHVIPKAIRPKINVIIPLHNKCHVRLNKLMEINEEELKKRKKELTLLTGEPK